jgi:nucleoside-diphosphate-sugar epimerase
LTRIIVLGAGFTGLRVVHLLQSQGLDVVWTNRSGKEGGIPFDAAAQDFSLLNQLVTPTTVVLHSIPTLRTEFGLNEITPSLVSALKESPPARVVYLSTTGVYGSAHFVDEHTEPAPRTERECLRAAAEAAVPWSSLVLRPAAIYGPSRGIHAAMRAGTFRLPASPNNFVSRIHVDDLAALACAGLFSNLEGGYPVADEEPCTSLEAAQFCATLLGIPLPPSAAIAELGETRRADRRVDGSAARRLLNVQLRYPSYKTGFPASLAAEGFDRSMS